MERLFLFFFENRAFFIFLLLEVISSWLIISSNHYQSAQYFNSSNSLVASINQFSHSVGDYFSLSETNRDLATENARLRSLLDRRSLTSSMSPLAERVDTAITNRYDYVSAKVVNNSVSRFTNFITIDRGSDSGIEEGMAVISHAGAIGKVKATSDHYSVVTSLLNIDVMISAVIERTGHFGTVQWEGDDPLYVSLKYIPRHVLPSMGDTVVTSGYNAIFPPDIVIGIIEDIELNDAAPFYEIRVRLSQDFQKLSYVTVVKSMLRTEQDSVELPFQEITP